MTMEVVIQYIDKDKDSCAYADGCASSGQRPNPAVNRSLRQINTTNDHFSRHTKKPEPANTRQTLYLDISTAREFAKILRLRIIPSNPDRDNFRLEYVVVDLSVLVIM